MIDNEELLFDELYEKTKEYGRTQFIKLLMEKERENQELKQKYEMQKDSNKLLCKVITCDDCNCSVCEAHKENVELKKQLEDANEQISYLHRSIERKEDTIIDLQYERIPYTNEYVDKLLNQQKEFIKYLEDEKDKLASVCSSICEDKFDEADDILQKYKEIIGG